MFPKHAKEWLALLFILLVLGVRPADAAEVNGTPYPAVARIAVVAPGNYQKKTAYYVAPDLVATKCEPTAKRVVVSQGATLKTVATVAEVRDVCVLPVAGLAGAKVQVGADVALGDTVAIYADDSRGYPAVAIAQMTGHLEVSPRLKAYQLVASFDLGNEGAVIDRHGDLVAIVSSSEKSTERDVIYIAIPVKALLDLSIESASPSPSMAKPTFIRVSYR